MGSADKFKYRKNLKKLKVADRSIQLMDSFGVGVRNSEVGSKERMGSEKSEYFLPKKLALGPQRSEEKKSPKHFADYFLKMNNQTSGLFKESAKVIKRHNLNKTELHESSNPLKPLSKVFKGSKNFPAWHFELQAKLASDAMGISTLNDFCMHDQSASAEGSKKFQTPVARSRRQLPSRTNVDPLKPRSKFSHKDFYRQLSRVGELDRKIFLGFCKFFRIEFWLRICQPSREFGEFVKFGGKFFGI